MFEGIVEPAEKNALTSDFILSNLPVNPTNGAIQIHWFQNDPPVSKIYVVRVDARPDTDHVTWTFINPATNSAQGAQMVSVDLTLPAVWRSLPSTIDKAALGHHALVCLTSAWMTQHASFASTWFVPGSKVPWSALDDDAMRLLKALLEKARKEDPSLKILTSKQVETAKRLGLL